MKGISKVLKMIINIMFFILGGIFGLCMGAFLTNCKWMFNAEEPQRILYNKKYYKVIKIDSEGSWKLAEIHNKNR
jgi:hypothetical protein